jgi:hypothetical protein
MKKLFITALILGTMSFAIPTAEAKTPVTSMNAAAEAAPQIYRGRNRRWHNRRTRVVTRTRITRVGRYRYRETIRTTYLPNGRTRTQVISRVRIGRW